MKYTAALLASVICTANAFTTTPSVRQSTALNLKVGEAAPDFSLTDQNGKTFTRSKNKKPLVVYFYPADSTPGCTVQAKEFQKEIQNIRKEFKADVVGISGQGELINLSYIMFLYLFENFLLTVNWLIYHSKAPNLSKTLRKSLGLISLSWLTKVMPLESRLMYPRLCLEPSLDELRMYLIKMVCAPVSMIT